MLLYLSIGLFSTKEVTSIYIKRRSGGPRSLLQVRKRLFIQMKSEKYWSLLANEIDLPFKKWEKCK